MGILWAIGLGLGCIGLNLGSISMWWSSGLHDCTPHHLTRSSPPSSLGLGAQYVYVYGLKHNVSIGKPSTTACSHVAC